MGQLRLTVNVALVLLVAVVVIFLLVACDEVDESGGPSTGRHYPVTEGLCARAWLSESGVVVEGLVTRVNRDRQADDEYYILRPKDGGAIKVSADGRKTDAAGTVDCASIGIERR